MIKINEGYLYIFKLFGRCEYLYLISKGIYLSFDSETKEYIDLKMLYIPKNPTKIENQANEVLNDLLRKGILEYIEED